MQFHVFKCCRKFMFLICVATACFQGGSPLYVWRAWCNFMFLRGLQLHVFKWDHNCFQRDHNCMFSRRLERQAFKEGRNYPLSNGGWLPGVQWGCNCLFSGRVKCKFLSGVIAVRYQRGSQSYLQPTAMECLFQNKKKLCHHFLIPQTTLKNYHFTNCRTI